MSQRACWVTMGAGRHPEQPAVRCYDQQGPPMNRSTPTTFTTRWELIVALVAACAMPFVVATWELWPGPVSFFITLFTLAATWSVFSWSALRRTHCPDAFWVAGLHVTADAVLLVLFVVAWAIGHPK